MIKHRRRAGWRVLVPFLAVAAASSTLGWAGEPATEAAEAEVQELVEKVTAYRAAKNGIAVSKLFDRVVEVHNRVDSESLQHDLQQVTARVLKDRKMGEAREAAVRALGRLEDPECAYKRLKRYLPSPKTKDATNLELAVLGAVGRLRPNAAVPLLLNLMSKGKDSNVSVGAIKALGGYGDSKLRLTILKEMVSYMRRIRPHYTRGRRVGQATRERWRALGGPLVRSLNQLTGQRVASADDWFDLYNDNKRRPKALFVHGS